MGLAHFLKLDQWLHDTYQQIQTKRLDRFLQSHHVVVGEHLLVVGAWPDIVNEGDLTIADYCTFRSFRLRHRLTVRPQASLSIGKGSFINDGVTICATQRIVIGQHCKIGDMTYIYDTDFHQIEPSRPVKTKEVVIGRNVWIGARSLILPGAQIGDHSVIGAGSVVTGDIPAKVVAVGVPARPVKALAMPDDWIRE
jgi:acetyltransferase-like isoleucine patch superfamily enzyme